jgi:hypothetical protein
MVWEVSAVIPEIMSALSGTKTVMDILKATLDAKTYTQVSSTLIDIQTKLIAVQGVTLQLQQTNAALHAETVKLGDEVAAAKKESDRLTAWADERSDYALQEVAPGAFAYVRKPVDEGAEQPGEAAHWLCCRCHDEGRKSRLQFLRHEGGCRVHVCHRCQSSISVQVPSSGVTVLSRPRGRGMFDGY